MSQSGKTSRTLLIVASVALFIAIIPVWPYGYYTFLRLLVCGVAAYLAYATHKNMDILSSHKVSLIIIAVLFNPLIPVYLVREIWIPIDIGIGIYFIVLINKLKAARAEGGCGDEIE